MTGVDLVVISSGTGHINPELAWGKEEETVTVNVAGFAALAAKSMEIFRNQGHGHWVGISSMAALMGSGNAPAYGASKAFVTLYLEALGAAGKQGIHVTEIRSGFVGTAMAQGEGLFWGGSGG
jgi:short-subunit dehydrogenase